MFSSTNPKEGFVAAMRASYDNLLLGITPRCLVVLAGFTVLLSPVIRLKQGADIHLDMSTSQAEKQTCVSEEERMMEM